MLVLSDCSTEPHPPGLDYIVVGEGPEREHFPRYSREQLRLCLQFAGWKPRVAERSVYRLFRLLLDRAWLGRHDPACLADQTWEIVPDKQAVLLPRDHVERLLLHGLPETSAIEGALPTVQDGDPASEPHKAVPASPAAADLRSAMRVTEGRACVVIILCGTSGTGKSTLAALLSARLGFSATLSSDGVRGALRALSSDPLLAASSYTCGNFVRADLPGDPRLRGFLAQCAPVVAGVERALEAGIARGESIILEGVHLRPSWAAEMALRYAGRALVLPFLVSITNEQKHAERFAVRTKTMTLRPDANRYIKHLRSIRTIQESLAREAALCDVPRLNNTNIDRSLDTIHATLLACLRASTAGKPLAVTQDEQEGVPGQLNNQGKQAAASKQLFNPATNTVHDGQTVPPSLAPVLELFKLRQMSAWSGRAALQDIRLARQSGAVDSGDSESAGPSASSRSLRCGNQRGSSLSLAGLVHYPRDSSSTATSSESEKEEDDPWEGGSVVEDANEEQGDFAHHQDDSSSQALFESEVGLGGAGLATPRPGPG